MFNSDEIETEMWNSEHREINNRESVLHEESHDSLYSSISLWKDYYDFQK